MFLQALGLVSLALMALAIRFAPSTIAIVLTVAVLALVGLFAGHNNSFRDRYAPVLEDGTQVPNCFFPNSRKKRTLFTTLSLYCIGIPPKIGRSRSGRAGGPK